jgi:hypothetical protein
MAEQFLRNFIKILGSINTLAAVLIHRRSWFSLMKLANTRLIALCSKTLTRGARRVALDFHIVDPLDLVGRNRSRPPAWGGGGARGSPLRPELSIMIMRLPQRGIAGEGR